MAGAGPATLCHGTNPSKDTTVTMSAHLLCIPGREETGRMVDVLGQLRRVQLTMYPGDDSVRTTRALPHMVRKADATCRAGVGAIWYT